MRELDISVRVKNHFEQEFVEKVAASFGARNTFTIVHPFYISFEQMPYGIEAYWSKSLSNYKEIHLDQLVDTLSELTSDKFEFSDSLYLGRQKVEFYIDKNERAGLKLDDIDIMPEELDLLEQFFNPGSIGGYKIFINIGAKIHIGCRTYKYGDLQDIWNELVRYEEWQNEAKRQISNYGKVY